MCKLFSCIVTKDCKAFYDPNSDSHENVIAIAHKQIGLRDDTADKNEIEFARVEITYPINEGVFAPIEKWNFRIDEDITPNWWNDGYEQIAYDALAEFIASALIDGKELTELDSKNRTWVRNSKIQSVKDVWVVELNNSKVGEMRGASKVGVMRGASKVGEMRGTSQVGEMRETSQVGEMRETSQVGEMRGTSQVGVMRETSKVGVMRETSQVGVMWGTSKVGVMWGTSQVGVMWGTSQVGVMWGTSQVGVMWGTSQVGEMWETSKVGEMRGTSKVGVMRGTSQVGVMRETSQVGEMRGNAIANIFSERSQFSLNDFAIAIDHSGDIPVVIIAPKSGIKVKKQIAKKTSKLDEK